MKCRLVPLLPLVYLLPLLCVQIAGCAGPSYYAQAVSGHLALMRSRESISDLLRDPGTDPQLARRLQNVERMLNYAHGQLGLPANGSYTRYAATGREAVTWNVVVAPEFSLNPHRWCFPVAGCVAYRGYFDKQRAQRFADKMRARSYDVMVSSAVAYSTLGWFKDPVLDTMLQYSEAELAGIIFHELAHERLYVKGDTEFNEAFADFVEQVAVHCWLLYTGQDDALAKWDRKTRAAIQFDRIVKESRQQLEAVYASAMPDSMKKKEKAIVFDHLRRRYRKLVASHWQGIDYFSAWMDGGLNNAHLALLDSYEGGKCAFEALYESTAEHLPQFYALADEIASLDREDRKAWLDRPCKPAPATANH